MTDMTLMGVSAPMAGASFSEDHTYRWHLYRIWEPGGGRCCFVMLNPSTADAMQDDPSVRRCINYAKRWGYGSLQVVNLFALRSTNPKALYAHPDPVGAKNDDWILQTVQDCTMNVLAWGNHGFEGGRSKAVLSILTEHRVPLHVLNYTSLWQPSHPLYLPGNIDPIPYLY